MSTSHVLQDLAKSRLSRASISLRGVLLQGFEGNVIGFMQVIYRRITPATQSPFARNSRRSQVIDSASPRLSHAHRPSDKTSGEKTIRSENHIPLTGMVFGEMFG